MKTPIQFLSLNIEGNKHLDLVEAFLLKHRPNLIALQEVNEEDVVYLTSILGYQYCFESMVTMYNPKLKRFIKWGLLIMWDKSFTLSETKVHHYFTYEGSHEEIIARRKPNDHDRLLLVAHLQRGDDSYRIVNTHFIWTLRGSVSELQRTTLKTMLQLLSVHEYDTGFILCGDFNAPRGKEIWDALALKFKDNIPKNITTTIDQQLHRAKGLQRVVDGVFTTKHYSVSGVEVIGGVSDHMAILATIG